MFENDSLNKTNEQCAKSAVKLLVVKRLYKFEDMIATITHKMLVLLELEKRQSTETDTGIPKV